MIKKLRKRASAPLSALLWLMLLALLPAQLSAREFEYTYKGQTLTYTVIDEDAKTVTTCERIEYSTRPGNNVSGDLEIPSEVSDGTNNYSVVKIGYNAFYGCSNLTSIIIPNTVTSIGERAFQNCSGLTSIDIPNSVTSIGEYAFYYCTGLKNIDIPNSVTTIGRRAFYNCSGLTSVIIPNSVTYIDNYAFDGCIGLKKSAYPSSISNPFGYNGISLCYPADGTYIFEDGYIWGEDKSGLYFVPFSLEGGFDIPASVVTIGSGAFERCTGLTGVTIPESVTSIDERAFYDCTGLTSVTIPNSVTSIGSSAFYKCSGLTDVTIGNSVTSIGANAFYDCTGLTSVTIPNSVTSIGSSAFYKCSGLTDVTIGNSVTSIGANAFYDCTGLTSVIIPNSVTSIGSNAFSGCSGLTDVTIGNSVTSIGANAFYDCTGLTNIIIPNSVTSIGSSAFSSCYGMTGVTIGNSVTSIGSSAFNGCRGLTNIDIPNSVTSIGNDAFYGCSGLTSVIIPNSVTTIGSWVFFGCRGLKKSAYPSSISNPFGNGISVCYPADGAYIDEDGCIWSEDKSGLYFVPLSAEGEFDIPNSVTTIGGSAFSGCSGMTEVTIGTSVTTIGSSAFEGCSGLTGVIIPNSVTAIWDSAFEGCAGLTSVIIPKSVTSIGDNVFQNCSGLTGITIPNSVITIGSRAFDGCVGLTKIDIPNSVFTIDSRAFSGCVGLTEVVIPNSVTYIGDYAFSGCTGLTKSAYPSSISNPFKNGIAIRYPAEGNYIYDNGCVWGEDMSALYFVPLDAEGEFDIPDSVTSIGEYAFYNCSGLTGISMGSSVSSIGSQAFEGCTEITTYTVENPQPPTFADSSFPSYNAEVIVPDGSLSDYIITDWNKFTNLKNTDGIAANKFSDDVFNYQISGKDEVMLISGNYSSMSSVSIPERVVYDDKFMFVTSIGPNAFKNCSRISTLVLPKRLKNIYDSAFEGCTGLTTVTFPATLTSIGKSAFKNCTGLESLSFNDNLNTIDDYAFSGCTGFITNLYLPYSLTVIGQYAFSNCGIISISASNLKVLGDYAFSSCNNLEQVIFDCHIENIGNYAFSGCRNLHSFHKYGVSTVGVGAFKDCSVLDNITVDWVEIKDETFRDCDILHSIILTDNVTSIGKQAFYDCDALLTMSIPASVRSIGQSAFGYCSDLNSFRLEDGLETLKIGSSAFYGTPIKDMYIGRDYTYSGSGSISTGISSLTYGNTVTSIPAGAFNKASGLKTVNFGSSIETIGENAFNGCALTELVLSPHVKTIGNNAFAGNALKSIAIGSEVTEIGEKAFDGANSLAGVSITALTPPMANNNTFSYYDCPLYVTPSKNDEVKDAYYNFTRCWYRFSGYDLIPADKVTIKTDAGSVANIVLKPGETMKFSATMIPANASLPYIFWRSTNPAFATVDQEGNVTLVDNGISAQADDAEAHSCQIIAETLYADVVASITVNDESTGIDDIMTDGPEVNITRPNDIYNLQGICLKRNASQEDIDALAPGLYIIAGKKVLVK